MAHLTSDSASRFAFYLVAALTGSAGCRPANPPPLAVVEAQPLKIPMPPPPGDESLFAYLKIRDVQQVLDWFGGSTVRALAATKGLNLSEVQLGKPAALFVWDPDSAQSPQTMPAVALLPVPAQGTLATRMKAMADSIQVETLGEEALVALNSAVAERAQTQKPALQAILDAQDPFDGLLYLHCAAIFDKYMPALRERLQRLEPVLAAAQRQEAANPQTATAMLENLLTSLQRLRAIAVGLKPYAGGFEVSTLVQNRQPELGGPIAAPDLAQFLPSGDLRVIWNSRDIKRFIDFYMHLFGPMLDEKPALRTQISTLAADWLLASRHIDMAMSVQFAAGRGYSSQGLARVEHPAAILAVWKKTILLFHEGPVHDMYQRMGVNLQVLHKPRVRKIKGWAVDRYEYRVTVGPEVTDSSARAIWEKLSGNVYEMAQVGPYLAFASNRSMDELVYSLLAGPSSGRGAPRMRALSMFPPGGHLYMDVNVPGLLAGLKALLPASMAAKVPVLPPQLEPLTAFGYDGGETGYYKLRLPGPLLAALSAAAK